MNALHLYAGPGQGKTCAAAGLCLRAAGHGGRVLYVQFLKDGRSGELEALRRLPGLTVWDALPMEGFFTRMDEAAQARVRQALAAQCEALRRHLEANAFALTVFDELAEALALGVLPRETGESLLDAALRGGETAVTGRDAPDWLKARADYWTELQNRRHPFDRGLPAREGIEW